MHRSFLFVPAANQKAMAKAPTLQADGLILDLEDALAPEQKQQGRAAVIRFLRENQNMERPVMVRINHGPSALQQTDIQAIAGEQPNALVVPKVESAAQLLRIFQQLQTVLAGTQKPLPSLWAMIETPLGVLHLGEICQAAKAVGLSGLLAGTNDLALELHCDPGADRASLLPHLAQIVLHARGFGLQVLDGVYNDFSDADGFEAQAAQGKMLGFDGKTLIHPGQIAPANRCFGPSPEQIKQAKAIVRAYSLKKNAGKGAINVGGQMIERLHLAAAKQVLAQIQLEKPAK
ncbi:Citrate lyase beta chain [hydrothermal vent metagenome]|uniref:Citrate lyase beta chain n=1 Tax=hydrothermal vent metagenome TaxID=652676 RepID=A0A3B0RGJ4_9ZZZZ